MSGIKKILLSGNNIFLITLMIVSAAASVYAADKEKFTPYRENGNLILFDSDKSDFSLINNYTAGWKKGSDLTPQAKAVEKNRHKFVEFTYSGKQGTACSTFWYDKVPEADQGRVYNGIRYTIDYDGDDYAKLSAMVNFTDGTSLTAPLTLEPGCNEYIFRKGFRRAKTPINWELINYMWLSATTGEGGYPLKFRLKSAVLLQEDSSPSGTTENDDTHTEDVFGKRLFNPRLKQVKWGNGIFPARENSRLFLEQDASGRTRRTAAIFIDKYWKHTGIKLKEATCGKKTPQEGIILRISRNAFHDGKPVEPHKEGYCLKVNKNQVVITGFDEPGLYYGLVTFFQLMINSMKIEEQMPVPCVEIYDWPDLHFRMVSAQGQSAFRNQKPKDNFGIEYMMEWTDRFVAGQKANTLYWDLSTSVRYERRPEFNGSERIYSLEDIKRFGQFCRDHFVEVCPAWQVGGHANWWLLNYHPELREKGYLNQSDVTHPEHNRIVFDCMLDVIEALDCKYLSAKSDEWWSPEKKGEIPDKLLNGRTRAEAFLEFHSQLNNWLKQKNITLLMYHDMLSPYHNGKRFDLYRIADQIPKDIIIQYWGGYDKEKSIQFLSDKGFPIWIHSTGPFITLNENEKKLITGAGKILYSLGNDKLGGLLDEYSDFNNMYASFRILDYAWNLFDYKEPEAGYPAALKNIMAIKPNPYASEKVVPVDISSQLNNSFDEFVKQMKPDTYKNTAVAVKLEPGSHEIGFIQTLFEPDAEGNCVVLRKGDGVISLPVNAKYSSLVFLHTAFINNPDDPEASPGKARYWLYGWPCGEYTVHYTDGKTIKLPVRLSMNIRRFDTSFKNRATNDNRYVYTVKDADQRDIHLFQWEWTNPRPMEKIAKITVAHDNQLDVSLILFAVSGREVWNNKKDI